MEMKRYHIRLFGIAETRWIQSGQVRLTTGELILYSGHAHERAPHAEGAGRIHAFERRRELSSAGSLLALG